MKIYCDNITLSDALGIVSKAVPSKSSVQILECVKLEAKGNKLTISANNLELAIECKIQADV
ncbi:MAG: DNA polymerase III subunit beta, partial [Clostridiaceae bacterium]|nr:DNA polymerase III subunit beta [Clostridiaceae bacterium]